MRPFINLSAVLLVSTGIVFAQAEKAGKDTEVKPVEKSATEAKTANKPAPAEKPAEKKAEKPATRGKVIEKVAIGKDTAPSKKAAPSGVRVSRASICASVVDHEPMAKGEQFPRDITKIYCFSEINGTEEPLTVLHKWYYKYQLVGSVALRVKSERFRTYSSKKVAPEQIGDWKVEIVNSQTDAVMEMITFKIE